MTGISIGAINTAVLVGAKDDPIKSLDYVWREKFEMLQSLPPVVKSAVEQLLPQGVQQSLAAFGNPGMYQINPAYLCSPLQATSVYNLHPLKQTLEEVIDLIQEIDQALPPDQDTIRSKPGYVELMGHKKIDALTVITSQLPRRFPRMPMSPPSEERVFPHA